MTLVRIKISFEYFCESCSATDLVEYEVREGNGWPKPFVASSIEGEMIAPGTHFVRTKSGKTLCLTCHSKEASE